MDSSVQTQFSKHLWPRHAGCPHDSGRGPTPDRKGGVVRPLRAALNKLRVLRNDLAHRHEPVEPLTVEVTAECRVGAAFGFHYVRIADEYFADLRPRTS
jgi:hypothetical protein